MPKPKPNKPSNGLRSEYDFTGGTRGKYATRVAAMARVVTLEPEVAAVFDSSQAVNDALRPIAKLIAKSRKPARRRKAG